MSAGKLPAAQACERTASGCLGFSRNAADLGLFVIAGTTLSRLSDAQDCIVVTCAYYESVHRAQVSIAAMHCMCLPAV